MEGQALGRMLQLRQTLRQAEDEGHFGPSSAIWRIHREAVSGLGLLRALLMELAHPWVAQGVVEHSTFQQQPTERLLAITEASLLLVFGSRSQADRVAARIRGVHARIRGVLAEDVGKWRRGTPYRADDPEALLWVWMTVVDTTLCVHRYCFGPLEEAAERAYLRDAGRLGTMLGIPPELLPTERRALDALTDRWLSDGTLAVGTQARALARQLLRVRIFGLSGPLLWTYRALELSVARRFLPAELRAQFGDVLRPYPVPGARPLLAAVPPLVRRLPERLRTDPIAGVAVFRWRPAPA